MVAGHWGESPGGSEAVTGSGVVAFGAPAVAASQTPFDVPEEDRYGAARFLGAGAMGRVEAVTDQRLGRQVAMKTIRPEALSEIAQRRFLREAALCGSLDHPAIVTVHDAGRRPDGSFYYTMRLVTGESLSARLALGEPEERRVSLLRPFHQACEAVAFAHAAGIVHRDLKPANIMMSDFGQVQVVDWGLACRLTDTDADPTAGPSPCFATPELTVAGAVVGTPAYMSPEQARGARATPATDVWALGAVLFEVATGVSYRDATYDPRIAANLAPELTAILAACLAPDPADRYKHAGELADDLGRHLDGRRVKAHAYTRWELLRRVIRAWRAPLVVALLAAVTLGVVGVASYRATVAERDRAVAAEQTAEAAEAATSLEAARADALLASSLAEQAVDRLATDRIADAALLAGEALLRDPDHAVARGVWSASADRTPLSLDYRVALPDDCRDPTLSPDHTRVACLRDEGVDVWELDPLALQTAIAIAAPNQVTFLPDADVVAVLSVAGQSPGGTRYLAAAFFTMDGVILPGPRAYADFALLPHPRALVSWSNGAVHWHAPRDSRGRRTVLSAPGDALLSVAADADRAVLFNGRSLQDLDLDSGALSPARPHDISIGLTAAALLPNGGALVGDVEGGLWRLDLASGESTRLGSVATAMVRSISVSNDATLALVVADGVSAVAWDLNTNRPRLRVPQALGSRVALSADGRHITGITASGLLRRFAVGRAEPRRFEAPDGITSAHLSPDGRQVVTTSTHLTAFDRDTGRAHPGPSEPLLKGGTFSADGARFYGISVHEGGIRTWDAASWQSMPLVGGPQVSGGRWIAMLGPAWIVTGGLSQGVSVLRDRATGDASEGRLLPEVMVKVVAVAPDAPSAIALTQDGRLVRMTLDENDIPVTEVVASRPNARTIALGPRGQMAIVDDAGVELSSEKGIVRLPIGERHVLAIAVAPDGNTVATAHRDGSASVWRAADGGLISHLRGHSQRVAGLTFDATGQWLVTASWDHTARLWHVPSMVQPLGAIEGRLNELRQALDFTVDANALVDGPEL